MFQRSIRTLATTLLLLTGASALAQQPLPFVQPPSLFDEGTQTGLTPAQLRELLPWSFDAQTELKETLANLGRQAPREQLASLERDLRRIVSRTEGSRAALLMRYVLNRGLRLSDDVGQESPAQAAWVVDQRVRLLKRSAEFALKYADRDVHYLRDGKVLPPYAAFGTEYAQFLMELSQSVLDASAQYRVTRLALGLLAWDLYQDERRLAHAPAITRLSSELDRQPERVPPGETDPELLARVRSLKAAYLRALEAMGLRDAATAPEPTNPWSESVRTVSGQNGSRSSDRRAPLIDLGDRYVPSGVAVGVNSDAAGVGPYLDLALPGFAIPGDIDYDQEHSTVHGRARLLPIRARIGLAQTSSIQGQQVQQGWEATYLDLEIAVFGSGFRDGASRLVAGPAVLFDFLSARLERREDLGFDQMTTARMGVGLHLESRGETVRTFFHFMGNLIAHFGESGFDPEMYPLRQVRAQQTTGGAGGPGVESGLGLVARLPHRMVLRLELGGSHRNLDNRVSTDGHIQLSEALAVATLAMGRHASLVAEGGWSQVTRRAYEGETDDPQSKLIERVFRHQSSPMRLLVRYRF
jgi:hypothetical protein